MASTYRKFTTLLAVSALALAQTACSKDEYAADTEVAEFETDYAAADAMAAEEPAAEEAMAAEEPMAAEFPAADPYPADSSYTPPQQTYGTANQSGGGDDTDWGVVAGVAVVGVGLCWLMGCFSSSSGGSSSGGSSGSDSYAYSDDRRDYDYAPRPAEAPRPSPSPEQRTYGLYGDCPQPGAGYGC